MKTFFLLSTLLVGAQAFAPASRASVSAPLFAAISEADMSESQVEIKGIQAKWNEIRLLTREEATAQLDGEWLEAYNRFYELYDSDMEKMEEIVTKLEKQIEPNQLAKKTKGQRKRDQYAKKLARIARDAAE